MALYEKTAAELSKLIHSKECSAVDITNSIFERIEQTEDKVGAYLTLQAEKALIQAEQVDKKIENGESVSRLAGIPIGIKDNIITKGLLTTAGSKMLHNFVPPYDATVMNKIHDNDMVVIGKLNMDEFAMGSSTETSYFKKTHNPHDLTRVPGGSSGGSAAAVAAGSAVVALGSDTGGSIRQPSALCGVYGLKPTYGTVSRYGLIAFASSLDQIGPMGRCTEDVAMLYDVIKGHDIMEATSIKREYINFAENLKGDVKGLRIGIPKEFFTEGIDAEVRDCVMAEIEKFKNCGAEIVEVSLPSTKYGLSDYYIIACAEASSNLSRFDGVRYGYRTEKFDNILDLYTKTRSEGFGEEVKRRILLGTFVLSAEFYDAHYKRAKLLQNKIQNEFKSVFEKCDVLMTPTSPSVAFKLGEKVDDPLKMYAADALTVTTNIAGVPALSVPCGKNDAGLPIGLQIIGPKFSEEVLFKVSEYYEKNIGTAAKIADVK